MSFSSPQGSSSQGPSSPGPYSGGPYSGGVSSPSGSSRRRGVGWGLVTLVVGVIAYSVVMRVMVRTDNLNLFPTLLLIGAVTVPLAVLFVAYAADQRVHGHEGLVALTAVFGGIVGTTTAGSLEFDVLHRMPWLGMLAVAVIEETAKLIVPGVIYLWGRRRTAGMGVVLGVASGAGFAVLETMGYGLNALIATRGNVDAVSATLLLRGLLSPAGHVAWTGFTVWALWRGADTPKPSNGRRVFAWVWVTAVILYAVWDGTSLWILHVGVVFISVLGLLSLIVWSRSTSRQKPTSPWEVV